MDLQVGGLLPLVEAKGGPLVMNIDIVKTVKWAYIPIWPGPIPSFAQACLYIIYIYLTSLDTMSNQCGHMYIALKTTHTVQ